jgi:hypothetical protein
MNEPAKQSGEPKQFTKAQRQKTTEWLLNPNKIAKEATEEATQKAVLLRRIRTLRQKLTRGAKQNQCSAERRKEIKDELQNLKELERQECGTGVPKDPSTRPSARELGFDTDTPSADEILEEAIIRQGLRQGKVHLIFAKLAKLNGDKWGDVQTAKDKANRAEREIKKRKPRPVECEAKLNRKIERTRERIDYGDIKEATEGKWPKLDRVIAENYFQSQKLEKPLRELSADKASVELGELEIRISPKAFERALRRLALVD